MQLVPSRFFVGIDNTSKDDTFLDFGSRLSFGLKDKRWALRTGTLVYKLVLFRFDALPYVTSLGGGVFGP